MTTLPKISIIIPAFNTKNVIQRTLDSLADQTYPNYEIIIINDGSTDGLKEFLDSYKSKNKNVIVFHQENNGVSVSRNKGIELATGKYLCFLDSDDSYHPSFLEKMASAIVGSPYKIACCEFFEKINEQKIIHRVIPTTTNFTINEYMNFLIEKDAVIHISCHLIEKNLLIENSITFDCSQHYAEDILFILSAYLYAEKCTVIHEKLFTYWHREDSAVGLLKSTDGVSEKNRVNELEGLSKIKQLLTKHNIPHVEEFDSTILKCLLRIKYFYLLSFQYKKLIKMNNEYNILPRKLSNSEERLFVLTKKNSYLIFFIGTLYYKYIKKLRKLNFSIKNTH